MRDKCTKRLVFALPISFLTKLKMFAVLTLFIYENHGELFTKVGQFSSLALTNMLSFIIQYTIITFRHQMGMKDQTCAWVRAIVLMQTHKVSNNAVENNVSIMGDGVGPKISNLLHETCLPSTSNNDIGSVPRMSNLQQASSSTSSSNITSTPDSEKSGTLIYMAPLTDLTKSSEDVKRHLKQS